MYIIHNVNELKDSDPGCSLTSAQFHQFEKWCIILYILIPLIQPDMLDVWDIDLCGAT